MSSDFKISGVVPPVVVPMAEDGSIDREAYEKHLNRMIDAGIDGLFFLGSSGEVAFSTDERRSEIIEIGMEINQGRLPVLAGCIDMQTNRVIEHARAMEQLGVDAIVSTAPFYAIPGPGVIANHFRAIHEAVDLPLFAYDIPVCVNTKLGWQELAMLGAEGTLAGVKDSSGDDVSFRFLVRENDRNGHPMSLLTGHEVVVDGAYLAGADGSVPGLANIDPVSYVKMWKAYQAGDWAQVKAIQDYLADLMLITQVTVGVGGYGAGVGAFKTALKEMGIFNTNRMPSPVDALEGENVEAIHSVLVDAGLI
ncbi:dihydrodipicolinate synthase family protein [Leptogranulimonas caecicola]|uniref:dihydrodipicolinate synthase family protein n=1 Tax=Leptogranulimonas caecicola TaxID=2894156 RepID=UPI0035159A34